jgi:hypothetical protein
LTNETNRIEITNHNGTKITLIFDEKPELKELQSLVDGYIEVAYENKEYQLLVNEEGLLGSYVTSRINLLATMFRTQDPQIPGLLVGDAVVLFGDAKMR